MKRIIIFTGKGGVGKTSIASAHARKASLEGYKTLLVSTDMAHNLGDMLEHPVGREETRVSGNLYALEIDPTYEMNHDFAAMMEAFQKLLSFRKEEKQDAMEVLEMFPGIEELFSLMKIQQLYEQRDYDLLIVDCAPTGETLSLLKFPELISWYMEKFLPVGRVALKVVRPLSKAFLKLELPDDKALNDIERLYLKMAQLQELLKNREICSVRLVTLPEKMVVEETRRNYMYMNLYGYQVDGLYINRVLPAGIDNDFFAEWLLIQERFLTELTEAFAEIPIRRIPWFDIDLNGLASLDRVCQAALAEPDLFAVRQVPPAVEYEKAAEGYTMRVYLPGIQKEEVEMHQAGNDIIIKIGNVKRSIRNPDVLRGYSVGTARFKDELLMIQFEKEAAQ